MTKSINKIINHQTEREPSQKSEKEIGGFKGQEPTTYGDWQHRGRVTDF